MPDHVTSDTHMKLDPSSVTRKGEFRRKKKKKKFDPSSVVREGEFRRKVKKKVRSIFA